MSRIVNWFFVFFCESSLNVSVRTFCNNLVWFLTFERDEAGCLFHCLKNSLLYVLTVVKHIPNLTLRPWNMHVTADMWTHIAIQSCLLAWRWSHAWNLTPWIAASENISQLHNTNNFICGWRLSTILMPWMYRYLVTNDIKVTQEIWRVHLKSRFFFGSSKRA